MPELPEVETIVRALKNGGRGSESILQKKVLDAELFWSKSLATHSLQDLRLNLVHKTVTDVTRRGKFVVIHFGNEFLFVHLRMSGDLRVDRPPLSPPLAHDRFLINFEDGSRLAFNDARKFGRVWFTASPALLTKNLGIEPFDGELTTERLFANLQRKKKQIKSLLLDQSFLAGLGNIYTDESLHKAGIHPLRLANSLSLQETGRLLISIRETLKDGIDRNGASIDWVYRGGDFQNTFRVYQQTGKPCPTCGTPIERIVVGQRGTHFCPKCQPERVGS
jgi:formamidopyrimidine-DNA glycosylase